jgi:magnesium transporter
MIVAFVFSEYTNTFNNFPLLIAFQPVISAISGNVGLQCSSVNVRALAIGLADVRQPFLSICPEVRAGLVSGTIMALTIGVVSLFWYEADSDGNTWGGSVAFAFAISFGMFCSIMSAAFTGSAAPLLFKRCGFDPSAMAGPLETAFQDIIGGTILLAVSAAILNAFGDKPDDDQSCSDCVTACKITASVLSFNATCVQACLTNDACTGS